MSFRLTLPTYLCPSIVASIPLSSISTRMSIRKSITQGSISSAISQLNTLNPDILEQKQELSYALQQQKLIEYIRNNDIESALQFARNELAPRAAYNPQFLSSMENVMSLLAFPDIHHAPMSYLVSPHQRTALANMCNEAILTSQHQPTETQLSQTLKYLAYMQEKLSQTVDFPTIPVNEFERAGRYVSKWNEKKDHGEEVKNGKEERTEEEEVKDDRMAD